MIDDTKQDRASEGQSELKALLAACEWEYDEADTVWTTSCGNMFVFTVDGPKENGMNFCPYCGKTLNVVANGVFSGTPSGVSAGKQG